MRPSQVKVAAEAKSAKPTDAVIKKASKDLIRHAPAAAAVASLTNNVDAKVEKGRVDSTRRRRPIGVPVNHRLDFESVDKNSIRILLVRAADAKAQNEFVVTRRDRK